MSFAGAARSGLTYAQPAAAEAETAESAAEKALRDALLCPFAMAGKCAFAVGRCKYVHGDVCEGCGRQCLHPHNTQQRTQHHATCQGSARPPPPDDGLTAEMYATSGGTGDFEDTTGHAATGDADGGSIPLAPETECGICMDTVEDKEVLSDRRYGLLEGCAHCFCLQCIRRWRADENKDNARKCPMCKQPSHYVVPSTAWPRYVSERHHIIQTYQQSLKRTKCMYYAKGPNECPFGTSCFYRHENPDGSEAQVRLRHYDGQEGPQIHRDYRLWDYLAQAEAPE